MRHFLRLSRWLPAILAAVFVSTTTADASGSPLPSPPADLVSFDNPSRAAIVQHRVRASLEPSNGGLQAADACLVVHPQGVPGTTPFAFLLWKDLRLDAVELVLAGASQDPLQLKPQMRLDARESRGPDPKAFWRRPPYDELGGYANARAVTFAWPAERGEVWPESIWVRVAYSGTVADSLRPPQVAYGRSFEETAGLIEPRGAYLAGSSFWYPSRPDETFTFDLAAEVPQTWRAVAQGAGPRDETGSARDRRIDGWRSEAPMNEIYLVAGPWTLHELEHAGVECQTFTFAETDSSIWSRYLRGTGRYLDLYGASIGPYPFPKFALVENFWQTGYGMPSFTLLGDRVIRLPFILDTSYGHEILHNWWGNGVFVKSEEGNWCEGLTSYGADYHYKELESAAAARGYRLDALKGYLDYVGKGEDIALRDFRERHDFATQAIGYGKALMVLHQLRRMAGDAAFEAALRDFYASHRFHRASWGDLLESVAKASGLDLSSFRAQWIDRPGAPSLSLEASTRAARDGGADLLYRLRQGAPGPGGAGEALLWTLSVPVRVTYADGTDTTWTAGLSEAEQSETVRLPRTPLSVQVDPDFELMRRLDPAEIPPTLSQTLGADSLWIVLATSVPADARRAYGELAADWAKHQRARVLDDDPSLAPPPGVGVWYLGLGPSARARVAGLDEVRAGDGVGIEIAGAVFEQPCSVVLAGGTADRPWAVLEAESADAVPVIGGKVPHYGKYGYLVFRGPTNAAKGNWRAIESPLQKRFALE